MLNDIKEALGREVELQWMDDHVTNTRHIACFHREDALTDEEKNKLRAYLGLRGFSMEIVFH